MRLTQFFVAGVLLCSYQQALAGNFFDSLIDKVSEKLVPSHGESYDESASIQAVSEQPKSSISEQSKPSIQPCFQGLCVGDPITEFKDKLQWIDVSDRKRIYRPPIIMYSISKSGVQEFLSKNVKGGSDEIRKLLEKYLLDGLFDAKLLNALANEKLTWCRSLHTLYAGTGQQRRLFGAFADERGQQTMVEIYLDESYVFRVSGLLRSWTTEDEPQATAFKKALCEKYPFQFVCERNVDGHSNVPLEHNGREISGVFEVSSTGRSRESEQKKFELSFWIYSKFTEVAEEKFWDRPECTVAIPAL